MPAAMLVGMLLGMAVAAVGILAFGRFFGMIELQMPAMLSGMLAGMIVAMIVTRRPLPPSTGAILGGVLGLATFVAVWLADAWLSGDGARWTR